MGIEDRGVLSIQAEGYTIGLQLVDPIYTINSIGDQVLLRGSVRRENQINRFGKNFEPTLATVSSRSKTISKQVQVLNRLHGDVFDDQFRFIADEI